MFEINWSEQNSHEHRVTFSNYSASVLRKTYEISVIQIKLQNVCIKGINLYFQ